MDNRLKRGFASDNNAGVHPEILKELQAVNKGHTVGYGDDIYTAEPQAADATATDLDHSESFVHGVLQGTSSRTVHRAS